MPVPFVFLFFAPASHNSSLFARSYIARDVTDVTLNRAHLFILTNLISLSQPGILSAQPFKACSDRPWHQTGNLTLLQSNWMSDNFCSARNSCLVTHVHLVCDPNCEFVFNHSAQAHLCKATVRRRCANWKVDTLVDVSLRSFHRNS